MKRLTLFLVSGLLAVSCVKSGLEDTSSQMGSFRMDMSIDNATRAVSEEDLLADAQVNIYLADYGGLVRTYKYSEMPEEIYLAAGGYRVDVKAGEAVKDTPDPASWDSKSYKGSKEFTVNPGLNTPVKVVANVNNAVTAISFDQTVEANFNDGYELSVALDPDNAESKLVYNSANAGSNGYFIIEGVVDPALTWTFTGTLAKDGTPFTKTGIIEDLEPGKKYIMNLRYTVRTGELNFTLSVDYSTENNNDIIVFEPVSTGLSASKEWEIWAAHATLHADVDPNDEDNVGKTVQFSYSDDGQSWTTVDAVPGSEEGTWKAEIDGLTPSTEYTYNLLVGGNTVGTSRTFKTDSAPAIPNGSFEYYSSNGKYYNYYDPACNVDGCTTEFWSSGNKALEIAPGNYVISELVDDSKDGSKAVCAQSVNAIIKFAAGNLFTGQFIATVGTSGGIVDFGRPWTSRPSALKLWCKYTTGVMDKVDKSPEGVTLVANQTLDKAQIKVAIGTWKSSIYGGSSESPVRINTTDQNTFIDYYTDENTIANGDIVIEKDGYQINKGEKVSRNTGEWMEIVIPLEYRNEQKRPTHIVVSCASSMYGDYFSGSTSSKLWVDAVELIYE